MVRLQHASAKLWRLILISRIEAHVKQRVLVHIQALIALTARHNGRLCATLLQRLWSQRVEVVEIVQQVFEFFFSAVLIDLLEGSFVGQTNLNFRIVVLLAATNIHLLQHVIRC